MTLGSLLVPVLIAAQAPSRGDVFNFNPEWQATSIVIGLLCIILGFPLLLSGWWLIRWITALATGGAICGAVIFFLQDHTSMTMAWVAGLSIGVLGGFAGWFLFQFAFALQAAALGFLIGHHLVMTYISPIAPLAIGLGTMLGVIGVWFGWKLAPIMAILQTVLVGTVLIINGMLIVCQPATDGERWLMMLLVTLATAPIGMWAQVRVHRRERGANK